MGIHTANPNGHFYSPVVDPEEVRAREAEIWPARPATPGITMDVDGHRRFISETIAPYAADFDYPLVESGRNPTYFEHNDQFGRVDARVYYALLRSWQPKRIIEVGSGYSTRLASDVNARYLALGTEITCIEPYPRAFLRAGLPGITRLLELKVQDVQLAEFARLQAGDILFIDSSHVAKTGSDVLHLYFEVLPRLAPGVRIHVHDIFLPFDYPRRWVLDENRSWNEQYLLRALLMYSSRFKVDFGCAFALRCLTSELGSALQLPVADLYSAGSIWLSVAV